MCEEAKSGDLLKSQFYPTSIWIGLFYCLNRVLHGIKCRRKGLIGGHFM